ncbi:transposon Ty3-I Gag-Pol polyprotein [Trichonephila clavipes]|nr:transposon Ty3-I Gag-Pol polyprotein [Trichonephila clavipes]
MSQDSECQSFPIFSLVQPVRSSSIFHSEAGDDSSRWLKEYERIAKYNRWDGPCKRLFLSKGYRQAVTHCEEGSSKDVSTSAVEYPAIESPSLDEVISEEVQQALYAVISSRSAVVNRRSEPPRRPRTYATIVHANQDALSNLYMSLGRPMCGELMITYLSFLLWETRPRGSLASVNDELFSVHTEAAKQPTLPRRGKLSEATFLGGDAAGFSNPPAAAKISGNLLDVTVDGLPVKSLMDSGASSSVPKGICTLQIGISRRNLPFEVIVLPNYRHDIILGWNFLKASGPLIDCGRSELTLNDVEVTSEEIVFKPLMPVCHERL